VAVCGASIGAYHAANTAFRHPDAVSHLISLSGSFDISSFFDGYHDDNIYFNSPYEYLPNVTDPWNTITWASSLAPANGITPATNRIGFRNSEFKRHQALARRRKMARPRMELLARHAAITICRPCDQRRECRALFLVMSSEVETSLIVNLSAYPATMIFGFTLSRIAITRSFTSV
jgi:pimeloyl-ACP methyl ester carboxylesterase